MKEIEEAKIHLQSMKPRSQRRAVLERKLVHLVVKQLKLENRKGKSRQAAKRTH